VSYLTHGIYPHKSLDVADLFSLYFSIVFVHGITGHREHTWSAGEGSNPWPETLLPTKVPDARILSFGYDATAIGWRPRISSNNIGDHAKNLLGALAACRGTDKTVMGSK
jgi:hypothetical protein